MKRVATYGTFDLFHIGHLRILKRARRFGSYLLVGLSVDSFCLERGKEVVIPYEQRKEILLGTKYVDEVIPVSSFEQKYKDIEDYKINVFVMGDDWEGKQEPVGCEMIYLKRTPSISTTFLKNELQKRHATM